MITLTTTLFMIFIVICLYLLVRNYCTYKYLHHLIERLCESHLRDIDNQVYDFKFKYEDLPSHESILFSIKPLEDKYWLSKEFIEYLNQNTKVC